MNLDNIENHRAAIPSKYRKLCDRVLGDLKKALKILERVGLLERIEFDGLAVAAGTNRSEMVRHLIRSKRKPKAVTQKPAPQFKRIFRLRMVAKKRNDVK
jgi:hypothetical protein